MPTVSTMDTQPNPVLQRPMIYTSEEDKLRAKFRHPEFAARAGEWYIRWRGGENWYRVAKEVGLRIDTARALRMRPDIAEEEMGREPEPPPPPKVEPASISVAEIEAAIPEEEWRPPVRPDPGMGMSDAWLAKLPPAPHGWSTDQWHQLWIARRAMAEPGPRYLDGPGVGLFARKSLRRVR